MATGTKHNNFQLPATTDGSKAPSYATDLTELDGVNWVQAIAGVSLSLYQAVYLAPYVKGSLTLTPSSSGGSLAAGTYYVVIAAVIPNGPQYPTSTTVAFLAVTENNATVASGPNGSILASWAAVNGAVSYQVWVSQVGGGAGNENYFFTTTSTSFTIQSTSTGGTSGTVPTASMPKQWQLAKDGTPTMPAYRALVVVAGNAGTVCYGQDIGVVTNAAWTWTPGLVYISASTGGLLTQTPPSGSSIPIGDAISATEIKLIPGGEAISGVSSVSSTDQAIAASPTVGAVVISATKTSNIAGQKLPAFYFGAGAPGAGTLAAGTYGVGDLYWDTSGNNFYICKTSGSNSTSVWQNVAGTGSTPTMVTKNGSKSGTNYTTTSTTFTDVDATNLSYTVNIPVGSKLFVIVSVSAWGATGGNACDVGLYDSQPAAVVCYMQALNSFNAGEQTVTFVHEIDGDGNSHTLKLQFATQSNSSAGTIVNPSNDATLAYPGGSSAKMFFFLETSN